MEITNSITHLIKTIEQCAQAKGYFLNVFQQSGFYIFVEIASGITEVVDGTRRSYDAIVTDLTAIYYEMLAMPTLATQTIN